MVFGAILDPVTAPSASLAEPMSPSGTLPAITAYPTAAIRWSGESWLKPWTPSLNQMRNRTSELVKTAGGMAAMLAMPVSPRSSWKSPWETGKATAWAGSYPPLLLLSLLQNVANEDEPVGAAMVTVGEAEYP